MAVRLKSFEINAIKQAVHQLDAAAKIYLFGSRVNMDAKGGDIDLLIFSQQLDYKDKLRIKMKLFEQIEEQKVDIVMAKNTDDPFVKIALEHAVLL